MGQSQSSTREHGRRKLKNHIQTPKRQICNYLFHTPVSTGHGLCGGRIQIWFRKLTRQRSTPGGCAVVEQTTVMGLCCPIVQMQILMGGQSIIGELSNKCRCCSNTAMDRDRYRGRDRQMSHWEQINVQLTVLRNDNRIITSSTFLKVNGAQQRGADRNSKDTKWAGQETVIMMAMHATSVLHRVWPLWIV